MPAAPQPGVCEPPASPQAVLAGAVRGTSARCPSIAWSSRALARQSIEPQATWGKATSTPSAPQGCGKVVSADFHAAYLASLLAELEVKATAVPPGDGGVGGEGGLAEDG